MLTVDMCDAIRNGLTPERQKALETEHGDIFVSYVGTGDKRVPFVMRPLTEKEFDGFRFTIDRGGPAKALAAKNIFAKSCVYPDADALKEISARYQGLPEGLTSNQGWKAFVGLEVEEEGKG